MCTALVTEVGCQRNRTGVCRQVGGRLGYLRGRVAVGRLRRRPVGHDVADDAGRAARPRLAHLHPRREVRRARARTSLPADALLVGQRRHHRHRQRSTGGPLVFYFSGCRGSISCWRFLGHYPITGSKNWVEPKNSKTSITIPLPMNST